MTLKTEKFARRPFFVDAIQVTEGNMQDVAKWCQGSVQNTDAGESFVKVRVHRPLNERQTKAFVNDWILFAGSGYKVYTPKAFNQSFELAQTVEEQADDVIDMVTDPVATIHHIHRSAVDGQFVSEEEAEANPDTTVTETVED